MRNGDADRNGETPLAGPRIVTVPNLITLARLAAVPFIFLALRDGRFTTGLVLVLVFASTDWIDGYLARKLDQVTALGAVIDPAVDRIFVIFAAFGLFLGGLVPLWAVLLVIVRDAVVMLLAGALMLAGYTAPPVSKLGKIGSFAVMAAAFLVVAGEVASGFAGEVLTAIASMSYVVGVTAGYGAAVGYARAATRPVQ